MFSFSQPGAIDKFMKDTQKVIELVAKDTEEKGLFEEAVKLYDLAKVTNTAAKTCGYLGFCLNSFGNVYRTLRRFWNFWTNCWVKLLASLRQLTQRKTASSSCHSASPSGSKRNIPLHIASLPSHSQWLCRYRTQGIQGSTSTTSTFHLLLDLTTFFDLFHTNKYDHAYNVI